VTYDDFIRLARAGDVVGHGPDVERPVDIRGPPMPLQVWNDRGAGR